MRTRRVAAHGRGGAGGSRPVWTIPGGVVAGAATSPPLRRLRSVGRFPTGIAC